jgi:hypothetical protein
MPAEGRPATVPVKGNTTAIVTWLSAVQTGSSELLLLSAARQLREQAQQLYQ